jgi:hypothetical protein
LITLTSPALNQEKQASLSNRHTNGDYFRHLINQGLTLNVSLKTEEDIEAAVKFFNDAIHSADWNTMPEHTNTLKTYDCPILIKRKIGEKKDSVEIGTYYEHQRAKDYLHLTQELKQQPNKNNNDYIQTFLQGLTPTESTD